MQLRPFLLSRTHWSRERVMEWTTHWPRQPHLCTSCMSCIHYVTRIKSCKINRFRFSDDTTCYVCWNLRQRGIGPEESLLMTRSSHQSIYIFNDTSSSPLVYGDLSLEIVDATGTYISPWYASCPVWFTIVDRSESTWEWCSEPLNMVTRGSIDEPKLGPYMSYRTQWLSVEDIPSRTTEASNSFGSSPTFRWINQSDTEKHSWLTNQRSIFHVELLLGKYTFPHSYSRETGSVPAEDTNWWSEL